MSSLRILSSARVWEPGEIRRSFAHIALPSVFHMTRLFEAAQLTLQRDSQVDTPLYDKIIDCITVAQALQASLLAWPDAVDASRCDGLGVFLTIKAAAEEMVLALSGKSQYSLMIRVPDSYGILWYIIYAKKWRERLDLPLRKCRSLSYLMEKCVEILKLRLKEEEKEGQRKNKEDKGEEEYEYVGSARGRKPDESSLGWKLPNPEWPFPRKRSDEMDSLPIDLVDPRHMQEHVDTVAFFTKLGLEWDHRMRRLLEMSLQVAASVDRSLGYPRILELSAFNMFNLYYAMSGSKTASVCVKMYENLDVMKARALWDLVDRNAIVRLFHHIMYPSVRTSQLFRIPESEQWKSDELEYEDEDGISLKKGNLCLRLISNHKHPFHLSPPAEFLSGVESFQCARESVDGYEFNGNGQDHFIEIGTEMLDSEGDSGSSGGIDAMSTDEDVGNEASKKTEKIEKKKKMVMEKKTKTKTKKVRKSRQQMSDSSPPSSWWPFSGIIDQCRVRSWIPFSGVAEKDEKHADVTGTHADAIDEDEHDGDDEETELLWDFENDDDCGDYGDDDDDDFVSRDCIVHFHGGGFISGSSFSHEGYLRLWASESNVPVISVDYPLAPENPYPIPLEACYSAYRWIVHHCSELGIKGDRILLAGDSAGANLVCAVTLRCIADGFRVPDGLLLLYPVLYMGSLPSISRMLTMIDPLVYHSFLIQCQEAYVGKDKMASYAADIPLLSPLCADDTTLSSFPPTYISTGALCPLLDDAMAFFHRLKRLSVPVSMDIWERLGHGFSNLVLAVPEAKHAVSELVAAIRMMTAH
eukprot:TRINITY_DN814_c0_g2_i1.p1 TRINITY_DN814_c0_g2~~TRINITY_DN814_c0_g2_i1.p1  ORF type:complete len:809 (-),score=214.35 TRINITY_DN814_c0_g2_i1:151-2577(-)